MIQEEKLEKMSKGFSKLNEEQQDYILGIMQALVFAKSSGGKGESKRKPRLSKTIKSK